MRLAWQTAKMIKQVLSISSKTKNFIQTYTGDADKLPNKYKKNKQCLKNKQMIKMTADSLR